MSGSMEIISKNIAEKTWKDAAGLSPEQAGREMTRLSREQPDLLAFIMGFTDDHDQEVRELALYFTFVVCRMFQASPARIRKISQKEIIESLKANEELLKSTEKAPGTFPGSIAGVKLTVQPHVMQYVIDALMEGPEEADFKPLGNEDKLFIFLLLKIAVELFDRNASSKKQ